VGGATASELLAQCGFAQNARMFTSAARAQKCAGSHIEKAAGGCKPQPVDAAPMARFDI
jgi:hypothetical protein